MAGSQRQDGVCGIDGLIDFRSPNRWQSFRHGPPVSADQPYRHDVFPSGHGSGRPRHDSGAEWFSGVCPEHAQRPETTVRPLSEDLDRLASGTREQGPRLLGKVNDLAALSLGRPHAP